MDSRLLHDLKKLLGSDGVLHKPEVGIRLLSLGAVLGRDFPAAHSRAKAESSRFFRA
jgi:hypothetical protein